MGYSTNFDGELKFKKELTASQLAHLSKFLGKDRRDIGFDGDIGGYWYHIDLELLEDFSGVKWDGSEKTYSLDLIVNWLTEQMKKACPDFAFIGELLAQGEQHDDRWRLVMVDGVATRVEYPRIGQRIECPCCGDSFTLEDSQLAK